MADKSDKLDKSDKYKNKYAAAASSDARPTTDFGWSKHKDEALKLHLVSEADYKTWIETAPKKIRQWAESRKFAGRAGDVLTVLDKTGAVATAVGVIGDTASPYAYSAIAAKLPAGDYCPTAEGTIDPRADAAIAETMATGWGYAQYAAYGLKKTATLCTDLFDEDALKKAHHMLEAAFFTRDLINERANFMGPKQLADRAIDLADRFNAKAKVHTVQGPVNYPMLWAVGKAASTNALKDEKPRLIEIEWGDPADPKLILIGKGITYDTGGLALKSAAGMTDMHRDMAGAAHALGLMHYFMQSGQKLHIKLVIPTARNSIGTAAYEHGAILTAKNGKTVEINNTDAEGRLILSDALVHACEDPAFAAAPIVNFATLTGASRAVCAPEIPVVMSNDNAVSRKVMEHGETIDDLYESVSIYKKHAGCVRGTFTDLVNSGGASFPGHTYAMHYLLNFVNEGRTLIHCDQPCWSASNAPGKAVGGLDQGLRNFARLAPSLARR